MVAKDFITNVTTVFPSALARVVPHESDRTRSKYTMKGISPRGTPIDLRGRALVRCQWRTPVRQSTESDVIPTGPLHKDCDLWFSPTNTEEMWTHMVESHLEIPRDPDNPRRFNDRLVRNAGRKFSCLWTGCSRFPAPGIDEPYKICMHVKAHLPEIGPRASLRAKYTRDPKRALSPPKLDMHYMNTPVDEKGHPIGIPLSALLVLRNLARQMLKIDVKDMRGRQSLIERHFALHMERICHVMTYNYSLRHYTPEFIQYVSKGIGMAHKLPRLTNGTSE
jgi:chromatin structure-remodeling complex subunit RSC9